MLVCSYPPDTVGMIRAAHEVGLKAKLFGGGMVGLQSTAIKVQLGPLLNGIVDYDFWLPWSSLPIDEAKDFLKQYQAKAPSAGVDPLGYYLPPFAYGYMQVLQQAVEGTKGLDQDKLADYLRSHTFKTVVGDVKFGPNGEWAEPRVHGGAVPEREGERRGAVQGPEDRGDPLAAGAEDGRRDLSIQRREEVAGLFVIAGFDPAICVVRRMAGSSPAMTSGTRP